MERTKWKALLAKMSAQELSDACGQYIWLSAYANNNPRSYYHWMCDMTYDECKFRGNTEIYHKAHAKVLGR